MPSNSKSKKKKKLGLFYGAISSLAIIALVAVFYFVVLVSTKPRSILLVTQKIESSLQKKFGPDNVSLDRSYIKFTNYGSLKVNIFGLRILYPDSDGSGKKSFIIPELETEFSLFDFLLLRFQPSKIKVVNPSIFLADWQKSTNQAEENSTKESDLSLIATLLSSIRKGQNPIENFEVENAQLTISGKNFRQEILLKKSQIRVSGKNKNLTISTQNQISLNNKKIDLNLGSNCHLSDDVVCDLSLQNLSLNSIAELHPSLKELSKINAVVDANVSFALHEENFSDLKFKIHSEKGDFGFLNFLPQRLYFRNFAVDGEYNHQNKVLNLSRIETDFIDATRPESKPHLNMSLLISELAETQEQKLDFDIRLQNVSGDEIKKFWPVTLHDNGIHDWVTKHISGGAIKDARTRFSLTKKGEEFSLDGIGADLDLAGVNLKYDKNFPEIKNISAVAKFTKNDMRIAISSGDVLQSKITEGLVLIEDFSAPVTMLKISGKASGHAANGLQHASNHPDFLASVEEYLNGNSNSSFDIRLPLKDKILFKDFYIEVNSTLSNIDNKYLKGGATISAKKNFGSDDFVTSANLTNAGLNINSLSLNKEFGAESKLALTISLKNPNTVQIKNISLQKTNAAKHVEKFSGDISFKTSPFLLTSVTLRNINFGKNHYLLTYRDDKKLRRLSWNGERINLSDLLESKPTNDSKDVFPNLKIQIAANQVELLREKKMRNFYLSLNCNNGLCSQGLAKANYNKQKSLNLRITPSSPNNIISGHIEDIGYLAEGFGISNVISDGDATIKIQHYAIDNKPVLKGELSIDNEITIFESETVKRFAKDSLFSQIRDKIFSSEKTTFNSVKVDFYLQSHLLNIRSLVANNYKIGITAKGEIDLNAKSCHLKGMIVPGFIINNLFGIGNIPVVGGVISGLLTGGEGGGLFGIRYEYNKNPGDKEAQFTTNKVSAFVPSTIQNLFE